MESCLIADDHGLLRDALALAVSARWPDARLTTAADWPETLAAIMSKPQVALLDLSMPGGDGRTAIAEVRRHAPGTAMIVVTGSTDDATLRALLADGIDGIVSKSARASVAIAAIELVLAGGRYLPPRVAELALETAGAPLTPRQRDVLSLIAAGRANKEIARELGLAPGTVKTHLAQAMAAIGATNRTDAAIKARAAGLV